MKFHRLLAALLCALMTLSLTACSEKEPEQTDRVPSTSPYAKWVEPWVRNVPQTAVDTGTIQFYFMSGEADPVGDYGKGIAKIYASLKKSGHSVECHLYERARHEILNDVCRDEVYRDISEFIK